MDARVNATVAAEDGQHELAFVWNWVDRSLSGLPADGARILQVRDLLTIFFWFITWSEERWVGRCAGDGA
jgi:hypothetical protein